MNSTRIHVAHVLFAAVAVFGYGCMSRPPEGGARMDQRAWSPQPSPAVRYVGLTNEPVREAAAAELGPEAAREIPVLERPSPKPVDPGAKALVDSMVAKLRMGGGGGVTSDGLGGGEGGSVFDNAPKAESPKRIAVRGLRNQGRCRGGEFSEFCERLAGLLTRAGEGEGVVFECVASESGGADGVSGGQFDYELSGTAYLATVEGFDVWELYLRLKPAANEDGVRRDWVVWESEGPVRVLRWAREGQPEVLPAGR